jgi:hypothetical protein
MSQQSPDYKGPPSDSKDAASIQDNADLEIIDALSPTDEKRLLRKMDLHIMPMLTVLYLFAFLDRGNIGNAKIEGLIEDLNMTGSEFNICCESQPFGSRAELWIS